MSGKKIIDGIAFSIEGLKRDADEIEACGAGNEAAQMRWAAAALSEAAATIARQPVMLDRALESNGDMQAEVARLREERAFTLSDGQRLLRTCDVVGVCDSPDLCFENPDTVVRCGPCAVKVSAKLGVSLNPYTHGNAEVMRLRRERDAALARVEKLRHQITEASDPDFILGAMDNVNDMDVTLDGFAQAASRAIRAALEAKNG